MEVLRVKIPYRRPDKFRLHTIGDVHGGTLHCKEEVLERRVKEVCDDPHAMMLGMGDKGEFITPKDKRFDMEVIAPWVDKGDIAKSQEVWYCDMMKPLTKAKIGESDLGKNLGELEGNHEDSIHQEYNQDVHAHICKELGVPDLGYTCFIVFSFERVGANTHTQYIGYFTHGAGWAVTKGTKLNRLERAMDAFSADLYGIAHMHDIVTTEKSYLQVGKNLEIKEKTKVGAITGCYFSTYTQGVAPSYGEKKGYPPVAIGSPVFEFYPDKGEVTVTRR